MSAVEEQTSSSAHSIPNDPAVPGQSDADSEITALVSAFEKYDFGSDSEFRAGLPAVIKSVKGRGASAANIDDVIARAQWFYFTRRQQSNVPFETYLHHRSGDCESRPMGKSITSPEVPTSSLPPPTTAVASSGLGVPSGDPPPFSSRPPSPPKGVSAPASKPPAPTPAKGTVVASALPGRFDTDGEGGITVSRACVSTPTSRAPSRAPSPPPSSTPSTAAAGQAQSSNAGFHDLNTGASGLPTPSLTPSSEVSTPDVGGGPVGSRIENRIENRVAVAAEMAAPAPSDAPQQQGQSETAAETSEAPVAPIETTAPAPDGPQLPFDEVVRLISTGRADQVPHHDVPDGLNETPASKAQMSARLKPWERATAPAKSSAVPEVAAAQAE